jgi:hypothetical protein
MAPYQIFTFLKPHHHAEFQNYTIVGMTFLIVIHLQGHHAVQLIEIILIM